MNAKEYTILKEKVESLQRDSDRAAGQIEQLKKQLKSEFACDSIKEADKLLLKLTTELEKEEKSFASELQDFEKKYGKLLG